MKIQWRWLYSLVVVMLLLSLGCVRSSGEQETCTVGTVDGYTTLECPDGSSVIIDDGQEGASCTIDHNPDGSSTLSCEDGTVATIPASGGTDGDCSVEDNDDGTATVTCPDGTSGTFDLSDNGDSSNNGNNNENGDSGSDLEVTLFSVEVDGDEVSWSATIMNNGPDLAEEFYVDFYLDRSTAPNSNSGIGDDEDYVHSLDVGQDTVVSGTVGDVLNGSYHSWLFVDLDGEIDDPELGNNVAGPEEWTVADGEEPDDGAVLEILDFSISVSGSDVTFEVEILNNSNIDVSFDEGTDEGGFFVDFFIDSSSAPESGDFGDVEDFVGYLAAGDTTTVVVTAEDVGSGTFDGWVSLAAYNNSDTVTDHAGPVSYTVD